MMDERRAQPVLLVQQLQEGRMYALLELQQLLVLLVVQELLAHQLSVARVVAPLLLSATQWEQAERNRAALELPEFLTLQLVQ